MIRLRRLVLVSLTGVLTCAVACAAPASAKKSKAKSEELSPAVFREWNLRDHYTISVGKAQLNYAVEDSQWRVNIDGVGTITDSVGFSIQLADGTVLDSAALGKATTDRETKTGEFGKYTQYWTEYPPKNGLVVRHSITTHEKQPFYAIKVEIGNVGSQPVEIAAINPVVLDKGGISNLGAGATISTRRFVYSAGCPTFGKNALQMLTVFDNPQSGYCMALGVLPEGTAASSAEFKETGGCWTGEVRCLFTPPIRLEPGKKMASDSACLSLASDAAQVDLSYGWIMSKRAGKSGKSTPGCWVTVGAGSGETDLMNAIRAWAGVSITHALIPAEIQKKNGRTADAVRKAGLKPGLALDLALAGTDGDAASSDGRQWYNLSSSDGAKKALANYGNLGNFDFLVVQTTGMPDDVLKKFNMTRTQVATLAAGLLREAYPGQAVLPSTCGAVQPVAEEWKAALIATSGMAHYFAAVGPVQVATGGSEAWGEDVSGAMAAYPGPFEMVGEPPRGMAEKSLTQAIKQHPLAGQPLAPENPTRQ